MPTTYGGVDLSRSIINALSIPQLNLNTGIVGANAMQNITVERLRIRSVRVKTSSNFEASGAGTQYTPKVKDNELFNTVGANAGEGYGIDVANDQADGMNAEVSGNTGTVSDGTSST